MTLQEAVRAAVFSTGLALLPLQAAAQAIDVEATHPEAQECYDHANSIALEESTSSVLELCTRALERGALETRDRAATHVNRGIVRAAREDYQNAIWDYDIAMGLHPEYGAIYVNRGNVFFFNKWFDNAIDEYTRALDAELNEYQVAHLNRGMAHEILGHYKDAEADYRRALEIAPNWAQAATKLERVLTKMN